MADTTGVEIGLRPPTLALLTKKAPRKGLLFSVLLHTATVAVMVWAPISFPVRTVAVQTAADLIRDPHYEVLLMPVLPPMAAATSGAEREQILQKKAVSAAKSLPTFTGRRSAVRVPDFAGPQEIVSDLPDPTNTVQTIRRPDLVAPPKLQFPIRIQSLVVLPAPSALAYSPPRSPAPPVEQPVPPPPELAITSKPSVETPSLPITAPKPAIAAPEPAPTKASVVSGQSLPVSVANSDASVPKPAVVLNAVTVQVEAVPRIPDAELVANFVVAPSKPATEAATAPDSKRGDVIATGAVKSEKYPSRISVESGTEVGAHRETIVIARTGAPSDLEHPDGSGDTRPGARTGTGATEGNGGLPGISISGGSPGRSGQGIVTSSIPRNPYALTIISGGSSGGASRELGVFGPSETVYTVYIPMSDAGGGPDWSMQYALVNSDRAGNGLLAPPVAVKKIQATAPKTDLTANPAMVFITGIIDEKGMPRALRAILASDARSQSAVSALSKWEFRPAQLDGNPVATKVLVGVTVMPAEDATKQN